MSESPTAASSYQDASTSTSSVDELAERLSKTNVGEDALKAHLELLQVDEDDGGTDELASSPIFTAPVLKYGDSICIRSSPFTQYGLLGATSDKQFNSVNDAVSAGHDLRVFFNTAAPGSVFICGSQGSGKSHTMSCLLENCLAPSKAAVLPRPLTGLIFHYDPWSSDTGGSACEAAYLSSAEKVSVRVLCPPTNIGQIRRIYGHLPRVTVEELRINQSDLNTRRMLDLMAVGSAQFGVPLYVHVVLRILRELRIQQQVLKTTFDYRGFKRTLMEEASLTPAQLGPLQQRLEALESFMVKEQVVLETRKRAIKGIGKLGRGNVWTPKAGQLTIVDLSCPCVTAETACSLFNICLSLFLEQDSQIGRVVALDEAHKFMTETAECQTLTNALLASIRLQRHQGMRVLISTQEPTISPRLLDLCSVTIVHRFSSPDWLDCLKKHLAGASKYAQATKSDGAAVEGEGVVQMMPEKLETELFSKIVALGRGEALMFAPSAIIGVRRVEVEGEGEACGSANEPGSGAQLIKLSNGVLKIRVRKRVTWDGGRSIMAV